MKKLFLSLLLLAVLVSPSLAGVQVGATVRSSGLRNPVDGTLSVEQSGARLSLSLGSADRMTGSADLVARPGSLLIGVGLVADRLSDSDFSSEGSSDTTTTYRKHDNGRHVGDKHVRHGKTVTQISNQLSVLSIGSIDLGLSPSLVLGVSARRGMFVESRVLFLGGGELENRTSVGLRW